MKLSVFILFISLAAFAHEDHDWRTDYEAYLSVRMEPIEFTKIFRGQKKRIDLGDFKKNLVTLSKVERQSTENLDLTRTFLSEEYKKIGFEVDLHAFGSGTNFIAEKKGTVSPEKILILSSHIDSVGNKGANDNGTGTIGVLMVSKELAKNNYPHTIRVLGFDREEKGLVGSDAYVATIKNKSQIIGNINFEMMGFHRRNDGGFHVIGCERPFLLGTPSEKLSTEIKNSISKLGLDLKVVKACTNRSDHASFWRAKIPAIVISENFFGGDADPCYHSKCDVVDERLNFSYMESIMEAVLDATEALLQN